MKIRLVSDIHTEFFNLDEIEQEALKILPKLKEDPQTILILAGDIGSMNKPANLAAFIDEVTPRFKWIYYIPGNHEYYGGNLNSTPDVIRILIKPHKNISFGTMDDFWMPEENLHIHMATLWTDYDNGNPLSMAEAERRMNDYRHINIGKRAVNPIDLLHIHKSTVEHLSSLTEPGDIIVTHHMPSFQSVPESYKFERVNGAYASNLEELILKNKPKIWMHGHTHDACDYMIGETRILCNPRGYGNQYKKNGYNPTLVVDIEEIKEGKK